MGLLLSILFSYVGAVEMMFLVHDIVHQVGLHHSQMKLNRRSSSSGSSTHDLNDLQENIRKSISSTHERLCESDTVQSMVDGVRYEKGYRIPNADEDDISKRWLDARANVNHVNDDENADNHIVVVNEMAGNLNRRSDDIYSESDSLRSSSLSVETVIDKNETAKLHNNTNHNNKNNNKLVSQNANTNENENENDGKILALDEPSDEMPQNIHFDEYSKEHLYELDGVRRKLTHRMDETRRRKGLKFQSSGDVGANEAFQRRRSEDIDGETDNPWGELKPEQFHDANLWKRERAMSIAENDEMQTISNENSYREQFKRTADNFINDNKNAEESYYEGEDVSNESDKTINLTDGSDIDEIVGDGKVKEFMDYIERIDNNANTSDKLQFKEFMESSKRQRYPSYNYEANKDDDDDHELLTDYSVVVNSDDSVKIMQNDIENRNTKRTKNNRKPNMFALPKLVKAASATTTTTTTTDNNEDENQRHTFKPVIRITSIEDERIEHFLHENGDDTMNNAICSTAEILIKSKTTQLFDCDENVNEMFKLDQQCDAVIDNRRNIFEIDERRQSLLTDMSSDSNQIDFNASADMKCFNREDSSASSKSNTFYEQSPSRLSDLEYIRGRDDWKQHYGRCEISEEIDSDNYHHLRRHSEADDTLEYIRGRDDWVKNQSLKRYGRRTSLPRIFEGGEHKIVIQDEIDSDEYHHNLFWNDKFRSASESMSSSKLFESDALTKFISDKSIQSSDDFVEISNTEINDVIENIIKRDTINNEDIEITVLDLATDVRPSIDDQENIFEPFIIISEAIDNETRGSRYSHIKNERTTPTIDSNSLTVNTTTAYSIDNNQNEIILLAENKFDNTERPQIETEFEKINTDFDENENENENKSITSQFLQNEIQSEKSENQLNFNTVVQITTNPSPNKFGPVDESPIKTESNMNIQTELPLTMKNERAVDSSKTSQKLKVENIEDLIRDVSLGPWFHK